MPRPYRRDRADPRRRVHRRGVGASRPRVVASWCPPAVVSSCRVTFNVVERDFSAGAVGDVCHVASGDDLVAVLDRRIWLFGAVDGTEAVRYVAGALVLTAPDELARPLRAWMNIATPARGQSRVHPLPGPYVSVSGLRATCPPEGIRLWTRR